MIKNKAKVGIFLSLLTNVCRFLLALTFVVSGFVKAVDPVGNSYKIAEYINALSWLSLSETSQLPISLSILQSSFEFLLGTCLFWGIRRRFVSILSLLTLLLFTIITFYIAVYNPISDCGCFGDLIHLTNWQSLYKNLLLLFCSIVVFINVKRQVRLFPSQAGWWISLYSLLYVYIMASYSAFYLPIIDNGSYRIGANIAKEIDEMKNPQQEYIFEKNGVQKVFTLDNYPDNTWHFIGEKATGKGKAEESLMNFAVFDYSSNVDLTDNLLHDKTYNFWLVVPHLHSMDDSSIDCINDVQDYCHKYKYPFYVFTASGEEDYKNWSEEEGINAPIYHVDESVLKSMVRSNPGLIAVKKGIILKKWGKNNIPDANDLKSLMKEINLSGINTANVGLILVKYLLLYIVPIFVLQLFIILKRKNSHLLINK